MSYSFKDIKFQQSIWIFLLSGILLYGNTLGHDFALDDAIVIQDNQFTKKGFSGIWDQLTNDQFVGFYGQKKDLVSGGRYRPLSMVMFNIEYALVGESAWFYHLLNVLFYILSGILLYKVLSTLFRNRFPTHWMSLALLSALLWFYHPIHTEVVANIKGRDEIVAFLLELATLLVLLNYLDQKKKNNLLLLPLVFFLALLAKENAITWLAIFPMAIFIFRKEEFKKSFLPLALLLGSSVVWLLVRYEVVGGGISNVADNLMNDPFLESTVSEKYATIVYTLGKYLQLLAFPHPLTYDYYPKHIPITHWKDPLVLLSLMAYLGMILFAIKGMLQRKLYGFSIGIYLITLSIASNLVFPIGAFMNERFVYVSSLGFAMLLAYFLLIYYPEKKGGWRKNQSMIKGLLAVIVILYSVKTISRNRVWKDNLSLALNDANISVNGAKSNVMAGGLLSEEATKEANPVKRKQMLLESQGYLQRALTVYPEYIDALILMGNVQWELHQSISNALPYYMRILNLNNSHQRAWQNIFIVMEGHKNTDERIAAYMKLLSYNQHQAEIYLYIGRAYGREKGDLQRSIQLMEKGLEFEPQNYDLLSNLGTAYGLQQNYPKAIEVLTQALVIKPNVAKTYLDLGLSYYFSGDSAKAKMSFDKAKELDPSINRSQYPV